MFYIILRVGCVVFNVCEARPVGICLCVGCV